MKIEHYEQTSMFDEWYEKYKITKPIRLIELFAGDSIVVDVLMNIFRGII